MALHATFRSPWLRRLLVTLGVVSVLVAAAGVALWRRPGLVSGLARAHAQQTVSQMLQRPAQVRAVSLEWREGLWLQLEGLQVDALVPGAPETVTAESVQARLDFAALWDSGGRVWKLNGAAVDGVRLVLPQNADGTWPDAPLFRRLGDDLGQLVGLGHDVVE